MLEGWDAVRHRGFTGWLFPSLEFGKQRLVHVRFAPKSGHLIWSAPWPTDASMIGVANSPSASVGALLSHCRITCCSARLVSCNYPVMSLCYWPT